MSFAGGRPNLKGVSLIGEMWWLNGHEAPTGARPIRGMGISGPTSLATFVLFRAHGADGVVTDRADLVAFGTEVPPQTASRVTSRLSTWGDDD